MASVTGKRLGRRDRALLDECRVGHLATADLHARPHVVPLCYAVLNSGNLVFAIDEKPKRPGRQLRRMANLGENDRFALVVDRWDETWSRLAYVLIEGRGALLPEGRERKRAIAALRRRYPQYVEMDLRADVHPVVRLRIERVRRWAAAEEPRRSAGASAKPKGRAARRARQEPRRQRARRSARSRSSPWSVGS